MLIRGFLVALCLVVSLAAPLIAKPGGAVWQGQRVLVRDFTAPAWRPLVVEMVAVFNAALPRRAPRLVYRPMPESRCEDLSRRARKRRGINVCLIAGDVIAPAAARTPYVSFGRVMHRATVQLSLDRAPDLGETPLCHEFMHATTGIPENREMPKWESSCVWGALDYPGSFDRKYARTVYNELG
jgi:hypothetical protein